MWACLGAAALAPLPGCGPSWEWDPVVALRSPPATRYDASGIAAQRVHRPRYWALAFDRERDSPGESLDAKKTDHPPSLSKKGPMVAFHITFLG